MPSFWDALASAGGQPPSAEIEAAARGFDRAAVRRVRRLVARGEAAPDVPQAWLAVAIAHGIQRQRDQGAVILLAFIALMAVAFAVYAVVSLTGDDPWFGAFAGVCALAFAWLVVVLRSRYRNVDAAERRNLEVLQEHGERYWAPAAKVITPPRRMLVLATATMFVFYAACFGGLSALLDDDPMVETVLARGLPFAFFMTVLNQFQLRRAVTASGS